MKRLYGFSCAAALVVSSCTHDEQPALAKGDGLSITARQVDAQLALLAPPVRQVMQTSAHRRELVDNLVRLELLARAAERDGLANDPAVQLAVKQALAARYHDRFVEAHRATKPITAAEVQRYFDAHRDDFSRPARAHVAVLFLAADEGSAPRARRGAEARALLEQILGAERAGTEAFAQAARQSSDDAVTKPLGGDLGFKTREELEAWGADAAAAAFELEPGQTSASVFAVPHGFALLHVVERMEAQSRRLDEVREQIAARLATQHADEDFELLVAKLREAARVRVVDAEAHAAR